MLVRMRLSTWLVAIGVALSIGAGVMLLRANQRLSDALRHIRAEEQLQAGDRLPALEGRDLTGARLEAAYGNDSEQRTLLLVFTPACPFCAENWPNWSRVLASARREHTRIIAVDPSGTVTTDYVRAHGLTDIPLVVSLDYRSGLGYKLRTVPTTMLIGPEGHVERIWRGVLDPESVSVLEAAVAQPTAPDRGGA